MMRRLRLTLGADVIAKAKALARKRNTSVSALVAEFVAQLSERARDRGKPAPITRGLRGLAKGSRNMSDRELLERAVGPEIGEDCEAPKFPDLSAFRASVHPSGPSLTETLLEMRDEERT